MTLDQYLSELLDEASGSDSSSPELMQDETVTVTEDRSDNPYRRFYSQDHTAKELAQPTPSTPTVVDFRHAMNMELADKGEGYAKVTMKVLDGYLNPIGSVHGGVLFTLADSACGAAVLSYGNKATTLNASINYMKPGLGCRELTAEARVLKHGSHVSVVECRISSDKGGVLAIANMSFFDLGEKATYTPEEKYSHRI